MISGYDVVAGLVLFAIVVALTRGSAWCTQAHHAGMRKGNDATITPLYDWLFGTFERA